MLLSRRSLFLGAAVVGLTACSQEPEPTDETARSAGKAFVDALNSENASEVRRMSEGPVSEFTRPKATVDATLAKYGGRAIPDNGWTVVKELAQHARLRFKLDGRKTDWAMNWSDSQKRWVIHRDPVVR